jgi:hypothetical protein
MPMFKPVLSLLPVLLFASAPALANAAEEHEAWSANDMSLRSDAAGISLPQTIAGLSLAKSGEVSNGGKGIDNYAQYLSEDGAIQATLYVYLPSYADSSLAAHMTDRAIMERFGAKTRRTAYASVPLAGQSDRAIRAVYDHAADGALTTAAGFVHAGRWLVKLRVTGPTERRKEVLAGLDGMLNGLRFDDPASVQPIAPARFAACPSQDGTDAKLTAQTPAAAIEAAPMSEGRASFCIRGQVKTAEGSYDVLQQRDVQNGAVIVPVDDAGTVMAFDPSASGKGYQLSMHSIGQTQLFGVYDRVPSSRQIAEILDGKDPQTAQARTTAHYAASGEVIMRQAGAAQ